MTKFTASWRCNCGCSCQAVATCDRHQSRPPQAAQTAPAAPRQCNVHDYNDVLHCHQCCWYSCCSALLTWLMCTVLTTAWFLAHRVTLCMSTIAINSAAYCLVKRSDFCLLAFGLIVDKTVLQSKVAHVVDVHALRPRLKVGAACSTIQQSNDAIKHWSNMSQTHRSTMWVKHAGQS